VRELEGEGMSIETDIRRWLIASGLPEAQVLHRDHGGEVTVPFVLYWLQRQIPLSTGPVRTHDPVEEDGVWWQQEDYGYEGDAAVVFVGANAVARAQRLDMWASTQDGLDAAERSSITVHSAEWRQNTAFKLHERLHPRVDMTIALSWVRGLRSRVDIATDVRARVQADGEAGFEARLDDEPKRG